MSGARRRRLLTAGFLAFGGLVAVATLHPTAARADNASQEAKKPVVPPKPYRLADGHPNWNGFWVPQGGLLEQNIGLGGSPEMPKLPPGVKPPPPPKFPFTDFPPLKSPYKERLGMFMMQMMQGKVVDPVAACYPPGMPRMMVMAYGMDVLEEPNEVAIISEWQDEDRHIWLDRKNHPDADDLDPSYAGDSVGHWEGNTLVVDTIGIRDDVPLNFAGLSHSDKLDVQERFTETKPGILEDAMTINDPDVFVTPWHTTQIYRYRPDLRIEEYICLENNRNVGAQGEAKFGN